MEKFIVANNTALRISDTQKGETAIVFLHGYLESLDIWDEFTKPLDRDYRIIAIDIPGHGISEVKGEVHTMEFIADVLKGVLDGVGVKRCFVVGHSMGGYVAEAFASKDPEANEGIVLFHPTPNPDSEEKKNDRKREIELIKADKKELIAKMAAPKGFAETNRRRLRDAVEQQEEQAIMTDDDGIVAILNGLMQRPDMNDRLRELKIPQLFIFGKHDEFIPAEVAEKLALAHPQAEVAWLENSGHMGFVEEPAAAEEILRAFIKEHTQH